MLSGWKGRVEGMGWGGGKERAGVEDGGVGGG